MYQVTGHNHSPAGVARPWSRLAAVVVATLGLTTIPIDRALATARTRPATIISSFPTWGGSASALTGVRDPAHPSGWAPPAPTAIRGEHLVYVADFTGKSLPAGWMAFNGSPGSDTSSRWAPSHVTVANGMLRLQTFRDPHLANGWVSGGLCQCGRPRTYGSYFVRSRATGPGPTQVELLWPVAGWPPEIDFDESYGATTMSMATTHFGSHNAQIQRTVFVNLTKWHTWGVIWTPRSITYTVDGHVWGSVSVPAAVPNQLMTLNIQQQTWCSSGWACPKSPQSLLVDWVAEYAPNGSN